MGIKDFADKAKDAVTDAADKAMDVAGDAIDKTRDVVGNAAEAVVDKVDDVSGGRVPDAVKNAIDKIDGEDEISEEE